MLILPLGYFSYAAGLWIWSCLSIFCVSFSNFHFAKILPINRSPPMNLTPWFTSGFICLFSQFCDHSVWASISIVIAFAHGRVAGSASRKNSVVWVYYRRCGQPKFFFGLFLFYFILRKEWTALRWFALLLSFAACCPFYFLVSNPIFNIIKFYSTSIGISSSWNASLYGFLLRLFGGPEHKYRCSRCHS